MRLGVANQIIVVESNLKSEFKLLRRFRWNPATKLSRRSQFWYKINPFWLKNWYKYINKDRTVQLKDWKTRLKDCKTQLKFDLYQKRQRKRQNRPNLDINRYIYVYIYIYIKLGLEIRVPIRIVAMISDWKSWLKADSNPI